MRDGWAKGARAAFRLFGVAIAFGFPPASAGAEPAADDRGSWTPAGIHATNDTLATAVARLRESDRSAGSPGAAADDRYLIEAGGRTAIATATRRGNDYAIESTLAGERVRIGRSGGERWHQNGAGTVHVLRADTQGDDFDRWPIAVFGFDLADCSLAGTSPVPKPAWVIAVRPKRDIPRWLYVDVASGDIVREISREGSRVETFDFGDVRGEAGARRAVSWRIDGNGGPERVTLTSSTPRDVALGEVNVPEQGPAPFSVPPEKRSLDVTIAPTLRVLVPVNVDGTVTPFQLDSGTPQIVLNDVLTRRAGATLLGHGIVRSLDAAGNVATDLPFSQIRFFLGGLLGYDFFRGRIVHVDFPHGAADVEPRSSFSPPPGALPLGTDWSEGMPLVTASVGGVSGDRFVIDLGSPDILLSKAFAERLPASAYDARSKPRSTLRYLEGPVEFQSATLDDLTIGRFTIAKPPALLEIPNRDNIGIPVDGVIGMRQLARFEWWFDADGRVTYYRLSAAP